VFPDVEVSGLRVAIETVVNEGRELGAEVLRALAKGLHLEDQEFFVKCHKNMWNNKFYNNASCLRMLNYPPVPKNYTEGTPRLGDHSDYGSLTLLFQDDVGGLEVLGRNGEWIHADPVEDAILINTGDLMELWTSGRIKSVRHRVLAPPVDHVQLRSRQRRSIAYFLQPDSDVTVAPVDGGQSDKYRPVNSREHLYNMLNKTFNY